MEIGSKKRYDFKVLYVFNVATSVLNNCGDYGIVDIHETLFYTTTLYVAVHLLMTINMVMDIQQDSTEYIEK